MHLPVLNFPEYKFNIKTTNNKVFIFDKIRNKWVVLNPEEWVRQNVVEYLIDHKKYPKNLIAIEKKLIIANRELRFDILVYDKSFCPIMIIECKAPKVKINQDVFDQIFVYNSQVKAKYLFVTNGFFHVICKTTNNEIAFLEELPNFRDLQ